MSGKNGGSLPLQSVLDESRVIFFDGKISKKDALNKLMDSLVASGKIPDEDELRSGIFHREELMSTGIGLGVAVPHVRINKVNDPIMALGIAREPIEDYESIDNQPVNLVFMIVAGKNQHEQHLKLLARISGLCKNPKLRERLQSAKDKATAFECLSGWEG